MKIPLLLLGLCATCLFSQAQPETLSTESLLRQQSTAWDAAIWNKDEKAIVANIGEGFRQMDGRGHVSTQTEFVADLLDPELHIDPYTVENFKVKVLGEVALLTGETHMTGTYRKQPFQSHSKYVDVYHRQNGRWVVIYIQITPVEK